MNNKFTEDDKKKFVEFLNFIAEHAEFKVNTQQIIDYFRLLSTMQTSVLPKINAHILEVIKVTEAPIDEVKE